VTRGFAPSEAEARAVLAAQAREAASPKAARMPAGTVHTPPGLTRILAQAADQL
jgi:hypothetical protein